MKKPLARTMTAIGVVVAILILVPVLTILLLPKDQVRQTVVARLGAKLQRPVQIRSADYRFWPSFQVRLAGVEVGAVAEPGKPKIAAKSIFLDLRLLPLLRRQVVITGIEIDRPSVETVLTNQEPPAGGGGAPPPAGSGLDLQIQKLRLTDGKVAIRLPDGTPLLEVAGLSEDLSAHLSAGGAIELSGETQVDSIRFHMVAGTFGEGLRLRFQKKLRYDTSSGVLAIDQATLDVAGVPVDVKGKVTGAASDDPQLDLAFTGGPGDVRQLMGFLPAQLFPQTKEVESSGTLRIEGTATGPAKNPGFHVLVALENGRVRASSIPEPLEAIRLRLQASPDSIKIEEFSARLGQSTFRAQVTLTGYRQVPHFLAGIEADLDLGMVSRLSLAKDSPKMSGRVTAHLIAEGRADQPAAIRLDGTARLSGVGLSGPALTLPLRDVNADLAFSQRDVTLNDASLGIGSSDLSLSGRLENFPALQAKAPDGGRTRMVLQVHSRQLLLDELIPPTPGKPTIPPLPPFDGSVSFSAERLVSLGIETSHVSARLKIDHGIVTVENVGLGVFGGEVGMKGSLDLTQPKAPGYDLVMDAKGIDVHDLYGQARALNRFSGLAGCLTGKMDAHTAMKGILTDSLMLNPGSLTSSGSLDIVQAQLAGLPLQKAVAGFLSSPALEALQISDWKQGFQIEQGKLFVKGLSLKAGPMELLGNGWQSLDGTIEMSIDLLAPPELVSGLRSKIPAEAASLLFGSQSERVMIPIRLTGKASSPSVSVDTGQLTAAARTAVEAKLKAQRELLEQQAKQQAGKMLERAVTGNDSTGIVPSKEKIEKEVKGRLGRLFGK